jgi:aspartyl aminopeptidase
MNPDTNHLKSLNDVTNEMKEQLEGEGYEPIPEELNRAAKRKLNGNNEAYVSRNSGGKLSKWAAKKRKQKRKMAKAARKKNRK